jgi:hypothetical protein
MRRLVAESVAQAQDGVVRRRAQRAAALACCRAARRHSAAKAQRHAGQQKACGWPPDRRGWNSRRQLRWLHSPPCPNAARCSPRLLGPAARQNRPCSPGAWRLKRPHRSAALRTPGGCRRADSGQRRGSFVNELRGCRARSVVTSTWPRLPGTRALPSSSVVPRAQGFTGASWAMSQRRQVCCSSVSRDGRALRAGHQTTSSTENGMEGLCTPS